MHLLRPTSRFAPYLVALLATLLFRFVLALMTQDGMLGQDDIPSLYAFVAFYAFFLAVVWLAYKPHRDFISGSGI